MSAPTLPSGSGPSRPGRQAAHAAGVERRTAALDALRAAGRLGVPESLPISERVDDLVAAIRDHQVVVVAGETGSGKSTQLPKLCLQLGRGTNGLIGHTQPRRVAARTIAERVAEELGTELGTAVGYTVRFTDRVGDSTLVKVMTDGILLAEIQRDRLLSRYDTLIIDEAHERSLNIDFILGYLRQLLPKRPDLKVIVTSATIDTERFAAHFADGPTPAPIVTVTGRTYPVEVRYRPYGDGVLVEDLDDDQDAVASAGGRSPVVDDRDQVQAVCDAVVELGREGPGDVLVFLSGEREIHDTTEALRRLELPSTEVLPLYARLSAVEQHRIFQSHTGRRIVLSTNVAETSLTVPGVRYVVDTGVARISRYSLRLKVQRLPIEPISRASADQRAGRCGRVAPGICIRLYADDDYDSRPAFTEPEILRTNLASVILQMTAIGLGDVAAFPFLEPPDRRAIRDGYALLDELGALQPEDGVDGDGDGDGSETRRRPTGGPRHLTPIGTRLARLPIDPRLARMVLEADRHGCVREVLVIASALSIQDPRERPTEAREAAAESHRRFDVPGSDFLAYVRLWDHLRERQRELSSNQFRRLCRSEFLNYLRVREWQDLYSQLRQVAGQVGVRAGSEAGHPDRVHQALLAGLLSHLGVRDPVARDYRGARNARFAVARGSSTSSSSPKWVMAAELVETNRLWARTVAAVQPEWAESVGAHLVKRSFDDPRWDPRRAAAVVTERVSLYGLPIVAGRAVALDRVDRALAREMFVRHALVLGEWDARHAFVRRNREFLAEVRAKQERLRRVDLVEDHQLVAFYEARVPVEVTDARRFDRWWKQARGDQPQLLHLTLEALASGRGGHDLADFPDEWRQDDLVMPIRYRFDPGDPCDGVTIHVPLTVLNRARDEGFDWQVAGFRDELVVALLGTLPKQVRRELIPMAEATRAVLDRVAVVPPDQRERTPLVQVVAEALVARLEGTGVRVAPRDLDPARVPNHLRVHVAAVDEAGRVLAVAERLDDLRRTLVAEVRAAVAAASPLDERSGITTWDVGSLPQVLETRRGGAVVRGYPALLDDGDSVSLRVLTNEALQRRVMRAGVRRLLLLGATPSQRSIERALDNARKLVVARRRVAMDDLLDQCVQAAVDAVVTAADELPWDAEAFAALEARVRDEAPAVALATARTAIDVLAAATDVERHLERLIAPSVRATVDDARAQLARLVRPGFVVATGAARLVHVVRYVRGIERRLDKLAGEVPRDLQRMRQVVLLEQRYAALVRSLDRARTTAEVVELGWMLEELRISVFAQSLGTNGSVSAQRIERELTRLGG
jgi:ATP-dependent helicase HrpA